VVGKAFFLKLANEINLLRDVIGGFRQIVWRAEVKPRQCVDKVVTIEFGDVPRSLAFAA
jgi:hypothetical protein